MKERFEGNQDLLNNILWSDEANFHIGGFVNHHNSHFWARENPKNCVEKPSQKRKITVWCGMTADRIVGPVIFRDTVNGDRYLEMLENQVWPVVSSWQNHRRLIFMQDGAPPHYRTDVREWLDTHFPNRWLGRAGPMEWPARSPDLTPCDFFLWGYTKEKVYSSNPKTLDELELKVREVIGDIPRDLLVKSCD